MSSSRRGFRTGGQRLWEPVRDQLGPASARGRLLRLRARAWLIVQAASGAALAWWVAQDLLGHPLPFFAPVTAVICLGLTYDDRVRRILELTIGVAIGILVGDLFVQVFGSGVWQILAVCVVAMSLAVLLGAGQLLMMQAGIQGVIITTLVAGEGEALGRWVDALVGGGVALAIAMLAPMRSTTERPRERAIDVVGHLSQVLTDTAQGLRNRDPGRTRGALTTARELSRELDALRDATAEARAAARLAPLLNRSHKEDVREVGELLGPLDLAIRSVRVLVRRAEIAVREEEFVPDTYIDMVTGLAEASATIQEHLRSRTPLEAAREDLVHVARASTWSHSRAGLSAEVMRAQVRSAVVDLLVVSGMTTAEARRRVPETPEEFDPSHPPEEEDGPARSRAERPGRPGPAQSS
ncbi:FUSC family protein [Ornithinimicrobium cerasi]|uniref:FUSC family protein n=1 Tax=Ornithinimicrobium cerasi TaxID=2248773 RepID=UPI000EFFEA83|nr:FUSC family protein [Ornithinimicrobium cerasi]